MRLILEIFEGYWTVIKKKILKMYTFFKKGCNWDSLDLIWFDGMFFTSLLLSGIWVENQLS